MYLFIFTKILDHLTLSLRCVFLCLNKDAYSNMFFCIVVTALPIIKFIQFILILNPYPQPYPIKTFSLFHVQFYPWSPERICICRLFLDNNLKIPQ